MCVFCEGGGRKETIFMPTKREVYVVSYCFKKENHTEVHC